MKKRLTEKRKKKLRTVHERNGSDKAKKIKVLDIPTNGPKRQEKSNGHVAPPERKLKMPYLTDDTLISSCGSSDEGK